MHHEMKDELVRLENNYSHSAFQDIVTKVKREKLNNAELVEKIEGISLKRFKEKKPVTISVISGNILEGSIGIAAIALPFVINSDLVFYLLAIALMTTLHPLSHYFTGRMVGIKFTHYYLNGPARIEPTLRIDHSSYLKIPGNKRALMHVSGVAGTLAAPLIAGFIALNKGAAGVASNLFILFLLLMIFELLTSTKVGDLMRAKREYGFK